jgi:hypothetical protein
MLPCRHRGGLILFYISYLTSVRVAWYSAGTEEVQYFFLIYFLSNQFCGGLVPCRHRGGSVYFLIYFL